MMLVMVAVEGSGTALVIVAARAVLSLKNVPSEPTVASGDY
jgi:hypothetical protein